MKQTMREYIGKLVDSTNFRFVFTNEERDQCNFLRKGITYLQKIILLAGEHEKMPDYIEHYLSLDNNDINVTDYHGYTVLHYSFRYKNNYLNKTFKILINAGANVDVQDLMGDSCLHYAISRNLIDIAEMLINAGADVDAYSFLNRSPLDYAVHYCYLDFVELLINSYANVNVRNIRGNTPLHTALIDVRTNIKTDNKRAIIKLLIYAKADIFNIRNAHGNTVYNYLSEKKLKQ